VRSNATAPNKPDFRDRPHGQYGATMRTILALTVLAGVVGLPIFHARHADQRYRNFRVVDPGVLYRSGQMPEDALERTLREYGIRTVISLRDSYTGGIPPDQAEEEFCKANGIRFFRISPAGWSAPDGSVPAKAGVEEFVAILRQREQLKPILVHCFAGVHRTGAQCAIYRMEFNGWPAEKAIQEMREVQPRRSTFEDDMLSFLRAYKRGS
jgi:tyrosine-protein phosphatase SIW14